MCKTISVVAFVGVLATIGCVSTIPAPPIQTPSHAPAVWKIDAVACALPGDVPYACQEPIAGATIQMHGPAGYASQTADGAGYVAFTLPAGFADSDVIIDADGYLTARAHIDVAGTHDSPRHNIVVLAPAAPPHVDPSRIPLGQLAAVRGAMWPQGFGLPLGPRPGQPDNIIATDFFHNYSEADQQRILDWENQQQYTHVVVGPLVDSDGYHGIYRPTDWREHWDEFLDIHQQFYDNVPKDGSRAFGQVPVTFIVPDGWTFEQARDSLTPYLLQPRAQKLIRFAVVAWEPTRYGWSSCTWAMFVAWLHQTLPNAVIAIHTVADVDAPVGTDALCDDNGKPNGEGWTRVANAGLHVWLVQNGAYTTAPAADPALAYNFGGQFSTGPDGAATHGAAWHFANAIASWPSGSAWGPGINVLMINAEVTSYTAFWSHIPEAWRLAWGDLAIASGAGGYLDGGSVAVPVRR